MQAKTPTSPPHTPKKLTLFKTLAFLKVDAGVRLPLFINFLGRQTSSLPDRPKKQFYPSRWTSEGEKLHTVQRQPRTAPTQKGTTLAETYWALDSSQDPLWCTVSQVPLTLLDRRVIGQNVCEVYFGNHSWWSVQVGSSHVTSGEHYTPWQVLKLV